MYSTKYYLTRKLPHAQSMYTYMRQACKVSGSARADKEDIEEVYTYVFITWVRVHVFAASYKNRVYIVVKTIVAAVYKV